ncbi:MAG: thiamine pyrophosphate-dependent enzyme [Solirubrobacteraceae bacterium]
MALTEPRSGETTSETLGAMYERMTLIREFEEATSREFADGRIPGFVHLSAGSEAVAVGVCAHLDDGPRVSAARARRVRAQTTRPPR